MTCIRHGSYDDGAQHIAHSSATTTPHTLTLRQHHPLQHLHLHLHTHPSPHTSHPPGKQRLRTVAETTVEAVVGP